MQGIFVQAIRKCQEKLLRSSPLRTNAMKMLLGLGQGQGCATSYTKTQDKGSDDTTTLTAAKSSESEMQQQQQHKGLENMTVEEVLMTKEGGKAGSWLCCRMDDTVYDAVKQMAKNNIGSLVVLKPGDQQLIAGIVTERDYLRKVIVQDRSSKYTRVGEIMTEQSKLITVKSDTNILNAMQLMAENHIRHVPVIDGKIVGMISIADVVRAVVEQQSGDVKRLNEFIRGEYY